MTDESKSNDPQHVLWRWERRLRGYRDAKGADVRASGGDPIRHKLGLLFERWVDRQPDLTPSDRDEVRIAFDRWLDEYDAQLVTQQARWDAEQTAADEKRRKQAAATAELKRQQDEHAAKLRADQERQGAARRAAQLDAARRNDDPRALLHAAVYLQRYQHRGVLTFKLSGPATEANRAALNGAIDDLNVAVQANRKAIAEAQASGAAPARIPDYWEMPVDHDAAARWLAAHTGEYELRVGRWEVIEYDGERHVRQIIVPSWDPIEHAARLYGQRVSTAGTVNTPETAHDPYARPAKQQPAVDESRTAATSRERPPLTDDELETAIIAFVRRYAGEHGQCATTREIRAGVRGKTARVIAAVERLHGEGVIRRTREKGRNGYRIDA